MPRRRVREPQWGPWPDLASANHFLSRLVQGQALQSSPNINVVKLGGWLQEQGLAPLAHAAVRYTWPELAQQLQDDTYAAAGEAALHFRRLQQIVGVLAANDIPVVPLKGAALAVLAYDDPSQRTMSDIDLWIRDGDMPDAVRLLDEQGFTMLSKQERPVQLQLLGRGEVQMRAPYGGLSELHWSPFKGWWLRRTAAVDDRAVWERTEAASAWAAGDRLMSPQSAEGERASVSPSDLPEGMVRFLAPEDMMAHLAVHLAVNHQYGLNGVRTLIDMALMNRVRPVRWDLLAQRARTWRVGTAVWLSLHLLRVLTGLTEVEPALNHLRPSRLRRSLLRQFVSPTTLLGGADLRRHRSRRLFLLLLVDRPVDAGRLMLRTLWPEQEWLRARYGKKSSHGQHLWNVLRHGQI